VPTPIKVIRLLPSLALKKYINRADKKEPVNENKKIYENSVPVIKACPKTFMQIKTKKLRKFKISRLRITGRFAIPILINGRGFGIMYSIAERNRQKAPIIAIFFLP